MRLYELYLLVSPGLDESGCDRLIKDVESILTKAKAKILEVSKQGRQKLGYGIKKSKEANHVLLEVEASPESMVSIKRQIDLMSDVLRVAIFTLSPTVGSQS